MYLLRLVWLESFLRPPYCSPSRGICRCLRVAPFGWGRRVWNARITWLFKRSIFRQLVLFIQAIRGSNSRRSRHLFYIYVYIHTLVILSNPAETIVIRSLSWSGNSCSFSSLNHLGGIAFENIAISKEATWGGKSVMHKKLRWNLLERLLFFMN